MDKTAAQWPPHVGDHVQIIATGASVVVLDDHVPHEYRVGIYSHTLGTVTTAPHRTFSLRELGPESAPLLVIPPVAATSRRRAVKQAPPAE